jgi:hypothetical protein
MQVVALVTHFLGMHDNKFSLRIQDSRQGPEKASDGDRGLSGDVGVAIQCLHHGMLKM